MKVPVTGATGFVGSRVVPRLLAAGHEVRALVRDPSRASLDPGVEVLPGDIRDPAAARAATSGAAAVIHLAALLGGGSRRDHIATSGEGARTVAQAAAEAGAERFVLMSSMAVYRDLFGRHDESAPVGPMYPYAIGKLAGERAVQDVARAKGLRYLLLRPPSIYGEGARRTDWTRTLAKMLGRSRVLPLPLGGDFDFSMVHVDTLAAACVAALETGARDCALNVADARPVRVRDIVETFRKARGRGPRVVPLPGALVAALAAPLTLARKSPLGRRLREGIVEDTSRAARELPGVDLGAHFFLDELQKYLASHA